MEGKVTPLVAECKIIIDREMCLSCAACPAVCHTAALTVTGLRLEIVAGLCDNCLLCTKVCPVGALRSNMDSSKHADKERL